MSRRDRMNRVVILNLIAGTSFVIGSILFTLAAVWLACNSKSSAALKVNVASAVAYLISSVFFTVVFLPCINPRNPDHDGSDQV